MTTLVSALYAEGRSDERFLPVVIQRTFERILLRRGNKIVEVLEPIILGRKIDGKNLTRAECILEAARQASGYHALIVHADADSATREQALNDRFVPGAELVRRSAQQVCKQLFPVIPVQMTEAWLLADVEAWRKVVGANLDEQQMGLPHVRKIEDNPDPKQTLQQALRRALQDRPKRRRRFELGTIYEPLARQISLDRLELLPSFQQFMVDATNALIALRFAT